ncbi:MAG TPA: hypothetical protein ENJ53_01075 [Phaeodactylibacter sp.]|nr:hypothetical protein [Phaeodactylibacter sp.]
MKYTYLFFFIFLFAALPAHAQKVLQIEKRGAIKTKKIYLGESITYRLKGSKDWHTETMIDIKVEEGLIIFSDHFVKVADIKTLKFYKNARLANSVEKSLYTFAASWLLFSLGGTLAGEPLNDLTWKVPVSSVALGWSFKKIFYTRKYRIGKKRRLRVLDLSFKKRLTTDGERRTADDAG